MSKIAGLQEILNWKLLEGSHEWPGPDGGTCINEAAIVAAGLPYREVGCADDFPDCFSRELGMLMLHINDALDDDGRQWLMRFVTLLAGSKAPQDVEHARCAFLIERWLGRNGLHRYNLETPTQRCLSLVNAWDEMTDDVGDDALLKTLDDIGEAFAMGREAEPISPHEAKARLEEMAAHCGEPAEENDAPTPDQLADWNKWVDEAVVEIDWRSRKEAAAESRQRWRDLVQNMRSKLKA